MSVFLARYRRHTEKDGNYNYQYLQHLMNWSELFPLKPSSEKYFQLGNSELLLFSFGSVLDRDAVAIDNNIVFIQGYGDQGLEQRFLYAVENDPKGIQMDFDESFSGVVIKSDQIYAYSSITGVEHIFVYELSNEVLVTNRLNLLLPWLKNAKFNKKSFKWMAARYLISDNATYFEGVFRLRPANICRITKDKVIINRPHTHEFIKQISDSEVPAYLDEVIRYFSSIFSGIKADKRLWLSGGKDSRAILGLLDAVGVTKDDIYISTTGELFSPDVMAAAKIIAELGLGQRYTVNRPSLDSTSYNFAARIVMDLLLDPVGCSLADIRSMSNTQELIIGGYQDGFKDKANTLPLEKYIQSEKQWIDKRNILSIDHLESLHQEHANLLIELLAGVPVNRYTQVHRANIENFTFTSATYSISYLANSEIHPFLDGKMYKLLLGVSDDILNSQFIHYYLCSKASVPIEALGFANDKWPAELVKVLDRYKMKIRRNWEGPYMFNPNFPSQKKIGLYNWRLDLIEMSSNFVREYILSNKDYFDFFNFDTFDKIMKIPREQLELINIYARLAYFKIALIHHFGVKVLSFSNKDEVSKEISRLLDMSNIKTANKLNVPQNREEILLAKLYDYEVSIAKLAEEIRSLRSN